MKGAVGLSLAATFGAAAGARYGLASMGVHADGVPLGYAAIVLFLVPALFVALAYAQVNVAPGELLRVCADCVHGAGRLLAGLAPAALMLCVSVERDATAAVIVGVALSATGLHALYRFIVLLSAVETSERKGHALGKSALLAMFCVVTATAALRVWWLSLPMLGGHA